MKSLHTRLDSIKDEVLEVTKTFGRFRAMNKFDVHDYVCFCSWIEEVTGDKNYGINPKLGFDNHQTLGDQLVAAFLHKVAQLTDENEKLRQRVEFLQWQLAQGEPKEIDQSLAVLQVCGR